MDCKEIVTSYLDGLNERFVVEAIDGSCLLQTPYLDPDNDPIIISVEKINEHFKISDQTRTMEYLFLHGIDIRQNSKQKWYLDSTLRRLNVLSYAKELYVEVPREELADGIFRLLEAIRSTAHLIFTAKTRSQMDFEEDVAIWLKENQIESNRKMEFIGISGKPIIVDFVIARIQKEPAFMYALHSETSWYAKTIVNKTIVGWLELRDAGQRFHSVCLLDDTVEENVWREPYPLLKRRTDTVAFWEERDDLLEVLA